MEIEYFEIHNETSNFKAGLIWGDTTFHFKSIEMAKEFKEAIENYKSTKRMLTELHNLVEFTNPAFKPGNSIYDRSRKLIDVK